MPSLARCLSAMVLIATLTNCKWKQAREACSSPKLPAAREAARRASIEFGQGHMEQANLQMDKALEQFHPYMTSFLGIDDTERGLTLANYYYHHSEQANGVTLKIRILEDRIGLFERSSHC